MLKQKSGKAIGRIVVCLYALIVIIPLYFVLVTSLKTGAEITSNPFGLPGSLSFENYRVAIENGNLLKAFGNSTLVAIFATAMQMLLGMTVSYCLYKLRHTKIGVFLYMVVMITMFLPGTGWVTLIRLYQRLKLYNSIWGVIINTGTARLAFNNFILYGAIRAVPRDLEEAAILDGCNDIQYVRYVLVHCIKPAIVSIGIFAFNSSWNSLMTPLLLLRDKSAYTLPLAIKYQQSNAGSTIQYNYIFASIVFSGILLVVLYLACQKYFVAALTGSVKG